MKGRLSQTRAWADDYTVAEHIERHRRRGATLTRRTVREFVEAIVRRLLSGTMFSGGAALWGIRRFEHRASAVAGHSDGFAVVTQGWFVKCGERAVFAEHYCLARISRDQLERRAGRNSSRLGVRVRSTSLSVLDGVSGNVELSAASVLERNTLSKELPSVVARRIRSDFGDGQRASSCRDFDVRRTCRDVSAAVSRVVGVPLVIGEAVRSVPVVVSVISAVAVSAPPADASVSTVADESLLGAFESPMHPERKPSVPTAAP